MTGDTTDKDNVNDDVESSEDTDENLVLESAEEGFADTIVEANLDDLVAKMDSNNGEDAARRRAVRKRLEELRDQKSAELDDTFNFNLDDEI